MKKLSSLLLSAFFLSTSSSIAHAQSVYVKTNLINTTANVTFSEKDSPVKKVVFWAEAKGNVSSPVALRVIAPSDAIVKAYGVVSRKGQGKSLVKRTGRQYPLVLKTSKELQEQFAYCPQYAEGGGGEGAIFDPPPIESNDALLNADRNKDGYVTCDERPVKEAHLCSMVGAEFGKIKAGLQNNDEKRCPDGWSDGQVCGLIFDSLFFGGRIYGSGGIFRNVLPQPTPSPDSTPTPSPTPVAKLLARASELPGGKTEVKNYGVMFTKDARKGKNYHLIKLVVDVSKLPAARRNALFVSAAMDQREYKGKTASLLKPSSDGGLYKGKPLFLMSTLPQACGQEVNVVRWKGYRASLPQKVKVNDMVMIGEYTLTRSAIGEGVLTGGPGTVELWNGVDGYGVPFKLSRTRQEVNGYKGK